MEETAAERIGSQAKLEIGHYIDQFIAELEEGTKDPDKFLSVSQMEKSLSDLRLRTGKVCTDMLSAYLTNYDETELIRRKKANADRRE